MPHRPGVREAAGRRRVSAVGLVHLERAHELAHARVELRRRDVGAQRRDYFLERRVERLSLAHRGERELACGRAQRGLERRPVTLFVLKIANELAMCATSRARSRRSNRRDSSPFSHAATAIETAAGRDFVT
jgi:hypothetical protein